ncbi:neuraminidase-like domain-containing protein [Xenorhabdus sp. PB62.4]|uniref:Tc toxin subunit A-related protein n=1 Tax=Xenorhabdus sp. PB62.4 TaxID=1851573 RepID=UPI001657034E|nr:neuraminidase-like domain-containing protein [Xenorhabdus sp. PB62.4]MBC8954907.1 insecticidal toxin complex protein A [Xenorhabdus sp. PB62.4]
MYSIDELLDKLNRSGENTHKKSGSIGDQPVTLPDIMVLSFAEVKELAGDSLSWGEKNFLYQQAQKALKENRMAESRILSRANPQLANAVHLGIKSSPLTRDYNDWFAGRAKRYVKPGNVASMFSPAAYLTEMYREARKLHPDDSVWNLDRRRPDLTSLLLSQANQDEEVATLTLASELLLNNIQSAEELDDKEALLEKLSEYRWTGMTPCHVPYETTRQAILLQDDTLSAFTLAPAVAALADPVSLLAIKSDISPELYNILTEVLTEKNASQLIEDNFGDIDVQSFCSGVNLAHYYHLSLDELAAFGVRYDFSTFSPSETYVDDQLSLMLNSAEGNKEAWHLRRDYSENKSQVNYTDLIPLGNGNYKYKFSVTETRKEHTNFRVVSGKRVNYYSKENFVPEANKDYEIEFAIPDQDLKQPVTLRLQRARPADGRYYNTSTTFRIEKQSLNLFLLRLNKAIRLSRAAQVSPQEIERVVMAVNHELQIDAVVLSALFYATYYSEQYGISLGEALILWQADITLSRVGTEPSQFDRLFNTPPLNGKIFSADGTALDLQPGESDDTFRLAVLKRAFQVNDSELYSLWLMAGGGDFVCTTERLSQLYCVRLLAQVHQLTVVELSQLLSVSPYAGQAIAQLSLTELGELIAFLAQTTRWLAEQKWSVKDIWLMTTSRYSTAMTPDVQNLLDTLRHGLPAPLPEGEMLITALSPLIAASVQLDSAEVAAGVLRWLDLIQPAGLTVTDFIALVQKAPDSLTSEESEKLVTFCQVMGQLALFVRSVALSAGELALLVAQPSRFMTAAALPHDLPTLQNITRFHTLITHSAGQATAVLTALSEGTLTPELLAQALSLDEMLVEQALQEVHPGAKVFASWQETDIALQWLLVATTLHITPSAVRGLLALKYHPATPPSYADWQAAADGLQAGLNAAQATTLQAHQDELLAQALEAYYLRNHVPSGTGAIIGADDLYGYLLMDTQVSAQVKTTRLAEAIASVQLYVNRALNGLEEGVNKSVKSRQYFTDWDTYNKRYSTWAGVSELVYYPENYIDPTLRIGQTGMMDTLLQEVSQSQLNSDTLEDGFKNYLASFEEIANLSVISGYHDNTDADEGNTWFIGHSRTTPRQFYWRKLEHSKGADGRYAANAWSEWKEIVCGMTPHQNLVRPVIFKSRLHVVWVEEEIRKDDDGTTQNVFYRLKLSWLRYDGSWASPFTFDLINSIDLDDNDKLLNALGGADESAGLFAAQYTTENVLAIYLYEKKAKYDSVGSVSAAHGIFVYSDMKGVLKNKDELKSVISESLTHLDTTRHAEVNFRIAFNEVNYTITPDKTNAYFSLESRVKALSANYEKQTVTLTPEITVNHNEGASAFSHLGELVDAYPWLEDGGVVGSRDSDFIDYTPLGTEFIISLAGLPLSTEMKNAGFDSYNMMFIDAKLDYSYLGQEGEDVSGYIVILTLRSRKGFNQGLNMTEHPVFFMTDENDNLLPDIQCFVGWSLIDVWDDWGAGHAASGPEDGQTEFVFAGFTSFNALSKTSAINVYYYPDWNGHDDSFIPVATLDLEDDLISVKELVSTKVTVTYPSSEPNKNITVSAVRSVANGNKTTHYFDPISFPWQELDAPRGIEHVLTFSAEGGGSLIAADKVTVILSSGSDDRPISLYHHASGAQYIQTGVYCTRLNTLFASQLVERADRGIDAILSMDTQLLSEPKMGPGTYATLELLKYTPAIHGDAMEFVIYNCNDTGKDPLIRGILSPRTVTTVNLFLPRMESSGNSDNLYVFAKYASGETDSIRFIRADPTNPDGWSLDANHNNGTFPGLKRVYGLSVSTEPMDFSGANALYFWELFYYTPMMMFQRLLQEQNFTEALRWMNYIWNPSGYIINGEEQDYLWNVRPLEEDTSWNATPLDSVDPDAVAQHDPMHYKVASFMKALDLLIARGDAAYRQLELDTLNEAKMWYTQALSLLGDEPRVADGTDWSFPQLGDAASQTVQAASQLALEQVHRQQPADKPLCSLETLMAPLLHPRINRKRELQKRREQRAANKASQNADSLATLQVTHEPQPTDNDASRTANSLTALFLPQINEKLQGYWKLLAQRLFNLRHNLSIDGQPLLLPIFAAPADPVALLSAAVRTSQGGSALPPAVMPLYRFPVMLENARGMVGQLIQFGNTLLGLTERQDAEALAELLQTQGSELVLQNIRMQEKNLAEMDAELKVLQESRLGAQSRFDSYSRLYDEDVNSGEKEAMSLYLSSSTLSTSGKALHMSAAAADMVPNIYGMAVGGTRFGGLLNATGIGIEIASSASLIAADKISRSESYRRRRQDWEIQRNNAQAEMNQADAQLAALDIRREAAELQKVYLETQQAQTQAQLIFLQGKFSSQALYNWLRGKLSAIYYQFYDLAVSRCLMAEQSWQYDLNDPAKTFIRPGAWQGTYAGLLAGENLMLMLGQMEKAYLEQDKRALEVTRTVSLAEVYADLPDESFVFTDKIATLLKDGKGSAGSSGNSLEMTSGELQATLKLSDLNIRGDYPDGLGNIRRIKQISVTLPALVGPYQDVRAVLSYGGSVILPQGCSAVAVSHGMNDSGQFQLDFNDPRYLPFEGIAVNDKGTLTLSFPDADDKQKSLLQSLNDIILHIRYTIRS